MTAFGPTFPNELEAAGLLGLPFSWSYETGEIFGRENLNPDQNATLDVVIADHDPNAELPAPPSGPEVAQDHELRITELEVIAGVRER